VDRDDDDVGGKLGRHPLLIRSVDSLEYILIPILCLHSLLRNKGIPILQRCISIIIVM
jgi:hypothetical protein